MSDQSKEMCNDASKSLGVMNRLLDALLDFSKLDAGSMTVEKRDIPISEVLGNIVSSNLPHATKKGLTLKCDYPDYIVYTDPALLERIIQNFVSNAIRYTDEGSVGINCDASDENLIITIVDSGAGIALEEQDEIFEEYYQLNSSKGNRKQGLGLGLSIVKHIALLLDYKLNVSSTPDVGSVFSVEVPLGNQSVLEQSQSGISQTPFNDEQALIVLLVDDDEFVANTTARLLQLFNMEVHAVYDGDQAMSKITNGLVPDFIVSDYRLPAYNGLELVKQVREALGDEIPAIITSGDTSAEQLMKKNLTKFKVLVKPVDPENLLSLIESRLIEH